MKILEKLGLNEFMAFVSPGALMLLSLSLWTEPALRRFVGEKMAEQEFVAAIVLIVVSYALGLVLAAWSGFGANRYVHSALERSSSLGQNSRSAKFWKKIKWITLWLGYSMPTPRATASLVEGHLRIAEGLDQYAGLTGLSILQNPWDRLATYRAIMTDRVALRGRAILNEAESIHRRMLFALGVALTLLLIAMQALARLVLIFITRWKHCPAALSTWTFGLPQISLPFLLLLFLVSLIGSYGLRRVAGQCWEKELLLTCSVTRLSVEQANSEQLNTLLFE